MEKEILDSKGIKVPKGNRIHIGIFGSTNAGKSTLVNLLTGQETSLVSSVSGTTTDPVYKPMEIQGVGATTLIDTAGFDDYSELGEKRVERTKKVLEECDILIYIERNQTNDELLEILKSIKKPLIKIDNSGSEKEGYTKFVKEEILAKIREVAKELIGERPLLEGLLVGGETVVLVMPQDLQAPKGRLILPQVQTIRALLDLGCSVFSCKTDDLERSLNLLKHEPDMIITDSQVFAEVYKLKPKNSKITSFSILMARAKGDITELVKGAEKIDKLDKNSKILISEACTHAPLEEDIGRIKIPKMLRAKYGDMQIDFSRGLDFPKELDYDLIIMCGSCMFNRARVMNRIEKAKTAKISVTNYGLAISKLKGILDKVEY